MPTHDLPKGRSGIPGASFRDPLHLFDTQAGELWQMVQTPECSGQQRR